MDRHSRELGDRAFRVLPRGAANRLGSGVYSTAELKTIQEVITLVVFAGFSTLYLGESLTINHAVGFALIVAVRISSSEGRCRLSTLPKRRRRSNAEHRYA